MKLNGMISDIDSVSEVIRITTDDIQPSPEGSPHDNDSGMFSGLVNRGDRLIILLNLSILLNCDKAKSNDGVH